MQALWLKAALLLVVLLAGRMLAAPPAALAVDHILYVNDDASGANDGSSWEDAFTDLQAALAAAEVGDEIWVAAGRYYPTDTTNREATFQLKSGVTLYGGFPSLPSSGNEVRDWVANETILSGDIGVEGQPEDNTFNVVTGSNTDATAVLDGFIVQDGNANIFDSSFPCSTDCGGGMHVTEGSPTLVNITFRANNSLIYGGGMYNYNASPTLTDVTFLDNRTGDTGAGGGMYNGGLSTSVTLTNVTFTGNQAFRGGGMYSFYTDATLTNVSFVNNRAVEGEGGGMYDTGKTRSILTDVSFTDNEADFGGGLFGSSPLILSNVTFSRNRATVSGGGMHSYNSRPILVNVTFSNNLAAFSGGGMSVRFSAPILTNVSFFQNKAADGGGMSNTVEATPRLVNCVFDRNEARSLGGAILNRKSNPLLVNVTMSGNRAREGGAIANKGHSNARVINSILWNNSESEIINHLSTPFFSHSLVQGSGGSGAGWNSDYGTDGGGNLDADPLLVAPDNPHLQAGSPAINAGDTSILPPDEFDLDEDSNKNEPLPLDLDLNPRVVGAAVDMGAYEFQGP